MPPFIHNFNIKHQIRKQTQQTTAEKTPAIVTTRLMSPAPRLTAKRHQNSTVSNNFVPTQYVHALQLEKRWNTDVWRYITVIRKLWLLARIVRRPLLPSQFRPSVRLFVTLVIHTKTVQYIEMGFAPYDTMLFEDSSRQISWS